VDGKLRDILQWGISSPGGARAPRGFPATYMTTALLGLQDRVTEILETGIDNDQTPSGRGLITKALGALAQDPLVARVMQMPGTQC
jgi:hypothetical protein